MSRPSTIRTAAVLVDFSGGADPDSPDLLFPFTADRLTTLCTHVPTR